MLGQCWVRPKDTSPCILLSSPGQEQEPGEEQNKHPVLLHTSSMSLDWNLLTQAQSSLNLWNTSQRETLSRKKISQNYLLLLLLLQKLTHVVWGICTAPHPYESVPTCTSPPQPSSLSPSARQRQLQTWIFHVTYKPFLQHPNSALQPPGGLPIYSHPLSYLCNNCIFMTGELPYYVQGCSGKGLLLKTFLKSEYRLSQTSTCLFRPAENSRFLENSTLMFPP